MGITKAIVSTGIVIVLVTGCNAESRTDAERATTGLRSEPKGTSMTDSYLQIPLETVTGDTTTLAEFKGSALLLVNVASKCGYTNTRNCGPLPGPQSA